MPRDKVWAIPIIRPGPAAWLRQLSQRLFAAPDARARQHGWQVSPVPGGFGRYYRDPRFDHLSRCPSCAGKGTRGSPVTTWQGPWPPCGQCGGTGRTARNPGAPVTGGTGHA